MVAVLNYLFLDLADAIYHPIDSKYGNQSDYSIFC